ncbi:hypothetical protein A0H81_03729 [Grifola frondosa]|uniref:SET domain-containing protein n=1 Tax=Grifola frondosa TaxID=5627 RepID=A0A1C7MIH2_GRIFR|nr:hypothetical protein A0H81_03729 [Grifola frondosa]
MNVSVKPAPGDNRSLKNILVAEKDFEAGDIIYKEHPIVAVLDADLQGKGSHCSHCLRHIQKGMAITPESDRLDSVYCSEDCQVKDKVQSQNLLFGLEPVLPPEMDNGLNELTKRDRNQAQETFTAFLKAQNKPSHLLAARIVARQVTIETAKMSANKGGPVVAELPEGSGVGEQYGLSDHIERLRFINANVSDEEIKKLCEVLASALPGLEKSITDERHAILLGKIAYNAIGICYAGGRDDRPVSDERPEDMERTRTPHGTSRQTGCGLYLVSSYLAHSCAPSARPLFNSGTSELHLVATHPIKKGDELTMAYVDVSQHAEETPEEARRRRRVELARGWKFKCECSRCLSETPEGAESELGVEKDESKVEEVLRHTLVGEPSGPPTGLE